MNLAPMSLTAMFPTSHRVAVDRLSLTESEVATLAFAANRKRQFMRMIEHVTSELEVQRSEASTDIASFARAVGVNRRAGDITEVFRPTYVSEENPRIIYVDETIQDLCWPVRLTVGGIEVGVMMSLPSYSLGRLLAEITVDQSHIRNSPTLCYSTQQSGGVMQRFKSLLERPNIEAWLNVFGTCLSGTLDFSRTGDGVRIYTAIVESD